MKHAKERVVAIDYFRGISILIILLSHSIAFSLPLAYLSGAGNLWTSAAEIFFLLSGITLAIVRGDKIKNDFRSVLKKSWRRAAFIYCAHIFMVFASLALAYIFISGNLFNDVAGISPSKSGLSLIGQILALSYSFGWAIFLMYYAVYMLIAPFALYVLKTRFWAAVPVLSALIYAVNFYILNHPNSLLHISAGPYSFFASWQVYFFIGLTLARFRLPILGWFYGLPQRAVRVTYRAVSTVTIALLAVGAFLNFNLYPLIDKLSVSGWLPLKAKFAYLHLLSYKQTFDDLLMNSRMGLLRPLFALLVLLTLYLAYQKHKEWLLSRTGRFVITMGRDTLWIFMAQAIVIPVLAALPLPRTLAVNLVLTFSLFALMWALTRRHVVKESASRYLQQLRISYSASKDNYLQSFDETR